MNDDHLHVNHNPQYSSVEHTKSTPTSITDSQKEISDVKPKSEDNWKVSHEDEDADHAKNDNEGEGKDEKDSGDKISTDNNSSNTAAANRVLNDDKTV